MKKIIIIAGLLIGLGTSAFSQQLPLYSQYMFNPVLLNPAVTGSHDNIPIRLTVRQQWVGIDKAPSTQAISGHMRLKNETMGVGGIIYADSFGPETKIGIQGNYSYILPVMDNDAHLAFGLSFQVFQYSMNYNNMVSIDDNDPALNYSIEKSWVPDSDFGLYFYSENYYAGLSVNQLIETSLKIGGAEIDRNTLVRHYNFMGGYKFKLENDFAIEPSCLVKGTFETPLQVDVNLKGIYQDNYWLAFSYRTSGDVIAMLGLKVEDFTFGFGYDYSVSALSSYQNGSFELMLGYDLNRNPENGKSMF